MHCLEAALHRAWPHRRPRPNRPGDALEVFCPEVLQLEKVAYELPSALRNGYGVRLGSALQACGKVWRLADNAALLGFARADQVPDHDEPGRDAHTGLKWTGCLQGTDRCDQLKSSPHRALGVVLVSLRISKIHEDAVAQVFRHEPAKALHGLGDALLISRNDLA